VTTGAYIRVSSTRQRDQGDSPANQRERCGQAGATVFYQDLAVSGFKLDDRRRAVELQRLYADIGTRTLTRLLCTRLDRVARRDQIVLELAELCDQCGVEFLSLGSGRVETRTASGWLAVKMELVFAEHYSRQLSESVRSGLAAATSRGAVPLSNQSLPFHLARTADGTIVPSEHWAAARRAIERVIAGDSLKAIASDPELPIQTGQGLGAWLRSPLLGSRWRGRDCLPPIATAAERDRLSRVLEQRRQRWGRNAASRVYALSGLCRCAACGRSICYGGTTVSRPGRRTPYPFLRCNGGCPGTARPHLIEQELVLLHLLPRMDRLAEIRATPPATADEHPMAGEWKRELRFRREFAATQADHDRIRELEGLIAGEKIHRPGNADPAKVAEIALTLSDNSLRGWLSRPEETRNADLRELARHAHLCLSEKTVTDVEWVSVQ
jgi:DNA invertase Pin-like site-specific DNA recombinase